MDQVPGAYFRMTVGQTPGQVDIFLVDIFDSVLHYFGEVPKDSSPQDPSSGGKVTMKEFLEDLDVCHE